MMMPSDHITFLHCIDMQQICAPLAKYGITFICYTQIHNDGTRLDLCSNYKITNFYYNETDLYSKYAVDCSPASFANNFILHATIKNDDAINMVRDNFSISNGISFVKKYKRYYETWTFAGHKNNISLLNFYITHLDMLKLFMLYFRDKTVSIIQKFRNNRLHIPKNHLKTEKKLERNIIDDLNDYHNDFSLKRYYFDDINPNIYLTQREIYCLVYSLHGYTAKEIAKHTESSHRSVETHLYNAKIKLGCYNKNMLRTIIYNNGLNSLFKIPTNSSDL